MLKYIDIRTYSIAARMWLWGGLFMLVLVILASVNTAHFRALGAETLKLTLEEVPVINTIHTLDSLLYRQTLLSQQILSGKNDQAEAQQEQTTQFSDLTKQFEEKLATLNDLMQNFSRLLIISDEPRWQRLQDKQQRGIQLSLETLAENYQLFVDRTLSGTDPAEREAGGDLQLQIAALHQQLEELTVTANNAVDSSEKKIQHLEYGARQMTLFLLFWFCLLPGIAGYFIIKTVVAEAKGSNTARPQE